MRKLRVYLDTSIISFIFADDSPEKRDITQEFFHKHINQYNTFISRFVLAEIENTTDAVLKEKLLTTVSQNPIEVIQIQQHEQKQIYELANEYINRKIIPAKKIDDAIHVAICSVREFDILLSWNFRHIANIKKQIQINNVNKEQGYLKELYLLNPMEVISDGE